MPEPKREHTPNDQRSIVKNPNNPAHDADQRNREKQQRDANPTQEPPKRGR